MSADATNREDPPVTTEPTQPLTEGTGKTDTPGVLAVETVAIGPECFATRTGDVLCWRGRNYVPQDLHSTRGDR